MSWSFSLPRRIHADLFVDALAAIQRARAGVQGAGHRRAIVCISVNDPFVMEEWGRDQEAQNVFLLPDGNGKFTEQMGLLVDKIRFELRQALLALLDARSRQGGSKNVHRGRMSRATHSSVSDADTMLAYLNPNAETSPIRSPFLPATAARSAPRPKRLLADAGYRFCRSALPHTIRTKALGAIASRGDGTRRFHQRAPDRRS